MTLSFSNVKLVNIKRILYIVPSNISKQEVPGVKMILNQFLKLTRRAFSSVSDGIIVSRRNDKAILQFDRIEKRNAMSNEMQLLFSKLLFDFENDSSVSAVIIKGNECGFSAGGDVVQFVQMITGDASSSRYFDESITKFYRGLLRLGEYKKPVISLADKLCMGGGAATAFCSSHPVVTERTIFAMPEVFIGFYPNVGANYFLMQLPNNFGMWIGLTGERFIGSEIIHLGLTKNYVKSSDLNKLEEALIDLEGANFESVSHTIGQFQQKCDLNDWHVRSNKVKELFSGDSVEQIVDNLKNDNTEFSTKIVKLFSNISPTSLKFTFNLFRESQLRQYTRNEALSADMSLFKNFFTGSNINDFREGTRSVLVDKKHKPNWIPKTLQEIDDRKVISHFTTNVIDIRSSSP